MGSSQSNISRLLGNFEDQIGLKIFHRSTRSFCITEFGDELLQHINKLLKTHDELIDFVESYKKTIWTNHYCSTSKRDNISHKIYNTIDCRIAP
jgi:hypothetical protein